MLRGTVVTMDETLGAKQVIDGRRGGHRAGKIKSVLAAGEALPTGSQRDRAAAGDGASDWVIAPGLINLHNHHAYNTAHIYRDLPLYENTYQWRDEDYYDTHIQYPKKVFGDSSADPTELGLPASTTRVGFDSAWSAATARSRSWSAAPLRRRARTSASACRPAMASTWCATSTGPTSAASA